MPVKSHLEINRIQQLNTLARTIAGSRSLYDVLRIVLQTTLELTGADEAAIFSGGESHCLAGLNRRGETVPTPSVAPSVIARVIHTGHPQWLERPETTEHRHPPKRRAPHSYVGVCLPLRSSAYVVGAFYLGQSNGGSPLTSKTLSFVQAIADQVSPAIETIQYLDDQRRYIHELERVLRTHQEVQQRVSSDPVTHLPNHAYFREHLAREFAVARRYRSPLGLLLISIDQFPKLYQQFGKTMGDCILQEVARVVKQECRESDVAARCGEEAFGVILPNTEQDGAVIMAHRIRDGIASLRVTAPDDVSPGSLRACLGVTALRRDDINAAALLDRADQAVRIAQEQGGGRIERWGEGEAEPLDVVKQRVAGEKKQHVQTVMALAAALAARDKHTHWHSREMLGLATELGRSLGLREPELEELELAAYLHDIGKLGVPEHILLKPKALGPEEWQIMKTHPRIGRDLVLEVADHRRLAEAIYYHHERWDGKGYPEGLKGEEIPVTARIVMVLDAYAAMTNDRPYRKALSQEEAIAELRRHAGTQFDPTVVERFLALIEHVPTDTHPPKSFHHSH